MLNIREKNSAEESLTDGKARVTCLCIYVCVFAELFSWEHMFYIVHVWSTLAGSYHALPQEMRTTYVLFLLSICALFAVLVLLECGVFDPVRILHRLKWIFFSTEPCTKTFFHQHLDTTA